MIQREVPDDFLSDRDLTDEERRNLYDVCEAQKEMDDHHYKHCQDKGEEE